MRGFLACDHADPLAEATAELCAWAASGALEPIETVYEGLARTPLAFIDMLGGATLGKTVVRLGG